MSRQLKSVDYLRLSLTDKCNLNCIYCSPLERRYFVRRQEVLSFEEMAKAVTWFVKAGIRKLRLTGGEPLLKKDIVKFIAMLKKIQGMEEVSLTTNGVCLKEMTAGLRNAGLDRINISLDSLKKERYAEITGFDYFERVWEGVLAAIEAGFGPVKLNVVLLKGINDDELLDFSRLTFLYPIVVRFIRFFPVNSRVERFADYAVESSWLKQTLEAELGKMPQVFHIKGNGPALYYQPEGASGTIGIIDGISHNFCAGCSRMRIDCRGRVFPCLFSNRNYEIKPLLSRAEEDEGIAYIKEIFRIKAEQGRSDAEESRVEMSSIGG